MSTTARVKQPSSSVIDLVAGEVEHDTFNVGVAGSSPAGVTMGIAKTCLSAGHETGDTAFNRLGHWRWHAGHRPPCCLTGCGARKDLALPNGGQIPPAHTNAGLSASWSRRGVFQASDSGSNPESSTKKPGCIGSSLYLVETVVGCTGVQVPPPRRVVKFIDILWESNGTGL